MQRHGKWHQKNLSLTFAKLDILEVCYMDDNIFSTSRSLQEKVSIKIQNGILIINTLKMTVIVPALLKSKRPKNKGKIICVRYISIFIHEIQNIILWCLFQINSFWPKTFLFLSQSQCRAQRGPTSQRTHNNISPVNPGITLDSSVLNLFNRARLFWLLS